MRKKILHSVVFLFVLIPGQIQVSPDVTFQTSTFGVVKEDWNDMFQLSYQLLFYQKDLSSMAQSINDPKVKSYLEGIQSIQDLSGSVLSDTSWITKGWIGNFKNEIDPLLNTTLTNLETHPMFITLVDEVFPEILQDKSRFLRKLRQGNIRFVEYLPSELQQQFQKDTAMIRQSKVAKAIGGAYNYYVRLMRDLSPKYEELLNDSRVRIDDLIEAYIDVVAEEQKIELVYQFLVKHQSSDLTSIIAGFDPELYNKLIEYRKALNPPVLWNKTGVAEEKLKNYLTRKNKNWYQLRAEIISDLQEFSLGVFRKMASNGVTTLKDFVENNPATKEYAAKVAEYFKQSASPDHDYIDIRRSEGDNYWVRLRLPSGALELLQDQNGVLDDMKAEVFLIYKPKLEDTAVRFHDNNQLFPDNVETEGIRESIRNLFVEVPLGLTIHDLIIRRTSANLNYNAVFKSTFDQAQKVSVNYQTKGIWTNFKYDPSKKEKFAELLQLPRSVGFQLREVGVDPVTWDPELTIGWEPQSFLADVLADSVNQIRIKLSTIAQNGSDFKQKINEKIKERLATSLQNSLNARRATLASMLMSESVEIGEVSFDGEVLKGALNLKPMGYEVLLSGLESDAEPVIPVNYQFYLHKQKPAFKLSVAKIPVAKEVKELVREKLSQFTETIEGNLLEEGRKFAAANLYEAIQFSDIQFDLERRSACGGIVFKMLDDKEISVCFDFTSGKFVPGNLDTVLEKALREYVRGKLAQLKNDQFARLQTEYLCNNIPETVDFYGLEWERKPLDGGGVTTATLLGGAATVTLTCTGNEIKISSISSRETLKEKITESVKSLLGQQSGFVQLDYPRFEQGRFVIDLIVDVTTIPELSFLSAEPLKAGTVSVDEGGNVTFNGSLLDFDVEAALRSAVLTNLDLVISQQIMEVLPPKIDFDGIAEIRISNVVSDLASDQVIFEGAVDFESLGGFSLEGVQLKIEPSTLSVSLDVPDAETALLSGIASNFMSAYLEESCESEIGICDANFNSETLTLTGVIKIDISGVITFPGIRFSLSPKKFDYTFNPTIPFYGVYPVAPGVVAIDPTIEFDFKKEEVSGKTVITLGGSEDARATARVGKVVSSLTISLSNLGRIDMKGTLKFLQVLPVYYGKGYIDIIRASFGMSQGTTGLLDKIIHFERKLDFYGDVDEESMPGKEDGTLEGTGELSFLGMEAKARLDGKIHTAYAQLDGTGSIEIPLVNLNGSIGTRYVPNLPMSHLLYGKGSLSGGFTVGEFDLSSFDAAISIHRVSAGFEVLGAGLRLTVPVAEALTEGKLLDLILSMFEFSLEDTIEMLKSVKNLGKSGLSFEFGDSDDVEGNTNRGREGSGGQEGTTTLAEEEIFDESDATGSGDGNAIIVNLSLGIQKVDKTTQRTIKEYEGRRCKDWDTWFGCFGGYENVYRDKVITEQSFNYESWPNHWKCLPDDFTDYYAIYHIKKKHPVSKLWVYDLVHPETGNKIQLEDGENGQGIIPFMTQTKLKADPLVRRFNNQGYMCLSKEDNQLAQNTDHCINIDVIPSSIYNKVKFKGNIGYKGDRIYIFTSAALPDGGGAFCVENNIVQTLDAETIVQRKRANQPLIDLTCNNCEIAKSSGTETKSKLKLSALKGYVKVGAIPRRDVQSGFEPLTGDLNNIVIDFNKAMNPVNPEDEADDGETDYDQSGKELRALTRNLADGSLVLFDRDQVIIVNAEKAEFSVNVPQVGDQDALTKFYELTSKVWIEINQSSFLRLFEGYLDVDGLSVANVFDSLKNNKYRLYKELKPTIDEYVQNWIYYGSDPNVIEVQTTQPGYNFSVWDYTNLRDSDRRFIYTFTKRRAQDANPMKLSGRNRYSIDISSLTDGLEITNLALSDHKRVLEQQHAFHAYRNMLFFHAKDTLKERLLLSAAKDRVVFGVNDTLKSESQRLKLVIVKSGTNNIFEYRPESQLHLLNFSIYSSASQLDVDLVAHKGFYNYVMQQLIDSAESKAYIQQFPGNEISYRAVIFTGEEVEVVWERDSTSFEYDFYNGNYQTRWNGATGGEVQQFNRKRIFKATDSSMEEQAKVIFSMFDGFESWYLSTGSVNPILLLSAPDSSPD